MQQIVSADHNQTKGRYMKSEMARKVDRLLEIWAYWVSTAAANGTGWSRLSNIGRIMENGGLFIKTTAVIYEPDNPEAEEINVYILELKRQHPLEGEAIIKYYEHNCQERYVADMLKTTPRNLRHRVKAAKTWLEGVMTGKATRKRVDLVAGNQ